MTDEDKVRGCVDEWEPGSQTPPPWLGLVLVTLVAALVGVAVWSLRAVMG